MKGEGKYAEKQRVQQEMSEDQNSVIGKELFGVGVVYSMYILCVHFHFAFHWPFLVSSIFPNH